MYLGQELQSSEEIPSVLNQQVVATRKRARDRVVTFLYERDDPRGADQPTISEPTTQIHKDAPNQTGVMDFRQPENSTDRCRKFNRHCGQYRWGPFKRR